MRTLLVALLFAGTAVTAEQRYQQARQYIEETRRTANPIRLLILNMRIIDELEATVVLDPELLDARLDLVRYSMMVPRFMGGSTAKAREQAAEIARRDPTLGHFATGYIAYRLKDYEVARHDLREAARLAETPERKVMALQWLGWLSQETQQYDEAFRSFEQLVEHKRMEGLYEIGRTAVFCRCRSEAGEEALTKYLEITPARDMPSHGDAQKMLRELRAQRR